MKKDIRWVIEQLETIADKHSDLEVTDMHLTVSSETECAALDRYGGTSMTELCITMRRPDREFIVESKMYE